MNTTVTSNNGDNLNLRAVQEEIAAWASKNFDNHDWQDPLMGLAEELGELNHALLKQKQRIRGTWQEHEVAACDAVGDLMVYLCNLCTLRGWDLASILDGTWAQVKQRDWKKDPQSGGTK